ncbi:hypothetical protein G5V59_25685 [Nocardioides sp. W3-2-3]|uniref:hypothetical protein n=1 Tax=Nocardioides convexus TaxID=2712224 RepID=UPI002418478E|nr:hypothetical protein [Nocardioides convexus]NHA01892.1 hypothetical protein [Nocardioides convexus]
MDMDTWLRAVGFGCVAVGLGCTVWSLYTILATRQLDTPWYRGLVRSRRIARAAKHAVFGKPPAQTIQVDATVSGLVVGSVSVTSSGVGTAGPLTAEQRIEALERSLQGLRSLVDTNIHDLGGRIDRLRLDIDEGVRTLSTRMEAAENEAAKVDAVAFNWETWGLLFTVLGTFLQGLAELV